MTNEMQGDETPQGSLIPPAPKPAKKVRFRRTKGFFRRLTSSKKGILALVATGMLVAAGVVGGVMWFIPYSESVAFCTTCHTMVPQHKSFEVSAHADVACGECHVEPTVQGWIKAKMAGTQELKALILNNYPTPIPPIPHSELPSTEVTCQKCHSLDRINTPGNPIKLILKPRYDTDESNSMQMVAVAIRPTGLGSTRSAETTSTVSTSTGETDILDPRGVHWHAADDVTVFATDEQGQTIPLVEYTNKDGQVESFVKSSEIGLATNVTPDIDRLKSKLEEHRMNCIDCHNMVGHNIPDPSQALDESLSTGAVSPTLPYIKRDALNLLNRQFDTDAQAAADLDGFEDVYAGEHPDVAATSPELISEATIEIRRIYEETATPAMKTVWNTYPDNLGHQRSIGCFRCHDGAHVKVVDGVATDEVIPSTCSTCHTFPQVGATVSGIQLGVPPESHSRPLYVFNHKDGLSSVEAPFGPKATQNEDCATCHQKSYCENCHSTGAIKVDHDEMLFNHAASVKTSSMAACAYCHQPVYCATCHSDDIVDQMSIAQGRLQEGSSTEPDEVEPGLEPSAQPSPSGQSLVSLGRLTP